MRHLARTIGTAVAVIAAAVPALLADPAVQHFVSAHPWLDAYYPLAAGVVVAVVRAYRERTKSSTPAVSSGSGASA